MHLASLARFLARLKAGRSSEAKIAIIAITTSSSISVNARLFFIEQIKIYHSKSRRDLSLNWTLKPQELFAIVSGHLRGFNGWQSHTLYGCNKARFW
jgi:hypothetical protein